MKCREPGVGRAGYTAAGRDGSRCLCKQLTGSAGEARCKRWNGWKMPTACRSKPTELNDRVTGQELPCGESNPGLTSESRVSLPLDHREQGPAEIRTRIGRFKVDSDRHYTTEPSVIGCSTSNAPSWRNISTGNRTPAPGVRDPYPSH